MTDFAPHQKRAFAFNQLLADLSETWSIADIADVCDIVTHAEYGEALENLIALGVSNGTEFDRGLIQRLEGIAAPMGMNVESLVNGAQHHPSAAASFETRRKIFFFEKKEAKNFCVLVEHLRRSVIR